MNKVLILKIKLPLKIKEVLWYHTLKNKQCKADNHFNWNRNDSIKLGKSNTTLHNQWPLTLPQTNYTVTISK